MSVESISNLSVADLRNKIAELEKALQSKLSAQRAEKISAARSIVAEYGLTQEDVFPVGRASKRASGTTGKVAPKYRHPETGDTWTGRGKPPLWIANVADRSVFEIKGEPAAAGESAA